MSSFSLTDPSIGLNTCDDGAAVNGWFPNGGAPSQYCKVASFLDTDVSFRYNLNKQWTIHGAITNLFNQAPPLDINTYGGGQLPYNPSMHMTGAIGRFVNIGANYKF
jgi:iron complex outermembrane receptor protein